MADLNDIELARPGRWMLKTGPLDISARMLDDAARFAAREDARPGYLKLGHTDERFVAADGEPAMGWLHNIRLEDDNGPVLKGDLKDLPDWLATAIPKHWPDRSIEGFADYQRDGEHYGLVVDGLALLGVTPPGMSSIRSLRDLPAALGIAASGLPDQPGAMRIVASLGTQTPPSEAVAPTPISEGVGMKPDPVKIREALGLDPDASDEEVNEAGLAAFPPANPTPVTAAAARGTRIIADSMFEEMNEKIRTLSAYVESAKVNERDEVITRAIQAGKFRPVQRSTFVEMWDTNPDVARRVIEDLTAGSAFPVAASGYAGDGTGEPAEYEALFSTKRKAG